MTLQFQCRPLTEQGDELWDVWRGLQAKYPRLDQPFLCREFAEVFDRVHGDVEVIVAERGGHPVAMLPVQRAGRALLPVAHGMNEFQAFLVEDDQKIRPRDWLKAADAVEFQFDHMYLGGIDAGLEGRETSSAESTCRRHSFRIGPCPYADLSRGFEEYCAELKSRGSRTITETRRKLRKLEREVGPLRFRLHDESPAALDALLSWKQAQHDRTGVYDTFAIEWVVEFLRVISQTQSNGFRGMLSALYAGERLVAVHLGLYTARVGHLWFPAYDVAMQKYSPGLVLMHELFVALAEMQLKRFDFGPGPQRYKRSWASNAYEVGIGELTMSATSRLAKRSMRLVRRSLKGLGRGFRKGECQ